MDFKDCCLDDIVSGLVFLDLDFGLVFLDIKSGLSGTLDRWKPYHLINIIKVLLLLLQDKSETALLFLFGIYNAYRKSTKSAYTRSVLYNRSKPIQA